MPGLRHQVSDRPYCFLRERNLGMSRPSHLEVPSGEVSWLSAGYGMNSRRAARTYWGRTQVPGVTWCRNLAIEEQFFPRFLYLAPAYSSPYEVVMR